MKIIATMNITQKFNIYRVFKRRSPSKKTFTSNLFKRIVLKQLFEMSGISFDKPCTTFS